MAEAADPNPIRSKHKAIGALFPYFLAQDRPPWTVDTFSRLASASKSGEFVWHRVGPYLTTLFDEQTPPFPDMLIVLASPYVRWHGSLQDENTVARWATAASAIPRTKEAGQAVVEALFQIASNDSLRPHIPVDIWAWLETRPSPSLKCWRRLARTERDVFRYIRAFGDVKLFKSYLLLVWSEWNLIPETLLTEMHTSIREDFTGISMGHHREDLIKQLDHVLGQLDRGLGYLQRHNRKIGRFHIRRLKEEYGELKKVLQEVDGEEANIPTRTLSTLILFSLLTRMHTESRSSFMCSLPLSCR